MAHRSASSRQSASFWVSARRFSCRTLRRKSATHSAVTIAGSVRLVKDGTGTLTLTMQNQTYGGGTDVAEGTLALGAHGGTRVYGAAGNTVWVRKGATFDINVFCSVLSKPVTTQKLRDLFIALSAECGGGSKPPV